MAIEIRTALATLAIGTVVEGMIYVGSIVFKTDLVLIALSLWLLPFVIAAMAIGFAHHYRQAKVSSIPYFVILAVTPLVFGSQTHNGIVVLLFVTAVQLLAALAALISVAIHSRVKAEHENSRQAI